MEDEIKRRDSPQAVRPGRHIGFQLLDATWVAPIIYEECSE